MKKHLLLLKSIAVFVLIPGLSGYNRVQAQALAPGDLAVIGWNALTDEVHLVALADITAGTEVKITDRGWDGTSNAFTTSMTGDGTVTWTVSGPIPAGAVLKLFLGGSDQPTTLENLTTPVNLSADIVTSGYTVTDAIINTGDQVFIYQGSDSDPFFVFGMNSSGGAVDAANWNTSIGAILRDSFLPNGTGSRNALVNGVNAIGLWGGPNQRDNVQYTGPTGATDRDTWLARITDLSNWTGSDANDITNPIVSALTPFVNIVPTGVTPDADGIVYVDNAIAMPGNGSSWTRARKFLSEVIAAAETNTAIKEIRVARGTYYPTGAQNGDDRNATFAILRGGVKLYGGYPSGGGARDYVANPTILSGDINVAGDSLDNSLHVMVIVGIPAGADSVVIDGFTITGGQADLPGQSRMYNGINVYGEFGGGVLRIDASGKTVIRNSTLTRNHARSKGGGIYCLRAPVILDNVVVSQNWGYRGGGIYNAFSATRVSHARIEGNGANNGGGMYNEVNSSVVVINTTISGNTSYSGGGLYNLDCFPEFFNVVISGNTGRDGAGMYCHSASPTFTNVTISGNRAEQAGGGGFLIDSPARFNNSVIWGNAAFRDKDLHNATGGMPLSLFHTLVNLQSGKLQGKALFWGDPKFVNAPDAAGAPFIGGNYRLQPGSPAINVGGNSEIAPWDSTDIAGNSRIYGVGLGGIVDLGAYESTEHDRFVLPNAQGILYVDAASATPGNGSSWGSALQYLSEATATARSNPNVREIHVAKGTYYPTGPQSGTGRDRTFLLEGGGLKLYGGYPNGGGVRDYRNNATILSGDINQPGERTDNSHQVLVLAGIEGQTDSLVVDGFVVKGGQADSYGLAPILGKNGFEISYAGGGGITASASTPTTMIRNCTFEENYAITGGGALIIQGEPVLRECIFRNNHVIEASAEDELGDANSGGAMFVYTASPLIDRCAFVGNSAPVAGAMANYGSSSPTVVNSVFSGNHAAHTALTVNVQSSPVFVNTLFTGNYTTGGTEPAGETPVPSVFMASRYGSAPRLVNCTVSGNDLSAGSAAPAAFFLNTNQSSVTVHNSIIYGNKGFKRLTLDTLQSESFFRYSLAQGRDADATGHNLAGDIDPLFVNAETGDYRLQACSPAIDRGSNDLLLAGMVNDADHLPRSVHAATDLGAFEFQDSLNTGSATLAFHADENTRTVAGPTDFFGNSEGCRLIARVAPEGADPVKGSVTARVNVDPEVAFHNGAPYVQRHYLINAQEGTSARITLYFTQEEFDQFNNEMPDGFLPAGAADEANKSNLRIYQYHGTAGTKPGDFEGAPLTVVAPAAGDIVWNSARQRWEVSFGVEGFSGFFVGSVSRPLPVRLVSFSGSADGEKAVALSWKVAEQQNIAGYEVEYSADGRVFKTAGKVPATNETMHFYAFRHIPSTLGEIAYYRLRILEADGTSNHSKIISVRLVSRPMVSVYPVPAEDAVWVEGKGISGTTGSIVNLQGTVLKTWTFLSDKQQVAVGTLPPGMYFLRFQGGSSLKVVKK
ncbi:choice-of-anchor Q domain-containing protein [Ravibacter arvi]